MTKKYFLNIYCQLPCLYIYGLCGDVKKGDDHSRVLTLFVQKIRSKGDGFKLHIMVADKNIRLHREKRVIHTILPMRPEFILFATMICSLKPSQVNNIVSFSISHKALSLQICFYQSITLGQTII